MLSNLIVRSPFANIIDTDLFNDLNNEGLPALRSAFSMRVDVVENEKEFQVHADLPGVQKEDISVEFKHGILTIATEAKTQKEEKEGEKIWRMERTYNKRSRSFTFNEDIDEGAISAKYENGVLFLTLPKKVIESKSSKIEIA